MKRGIGKYNSKLPLKYFSCGKIVHFASKFPYAKKSDSDEDDSFKPYKKYNNYKNKNRGKFGKKKSLYTKRDNSSGGDSDNDNGSDSDDDGKMDKVLFMAIKSNEDPNGDEESEVEGEVDLEVELISSLKELKKFKKENRVLKEEAQRFEQIIADLKVKLEESKIIKDSLTKN